MLSSERQSRYAAATFAALFTAFTIRYASFVGALGDGAGYVSEARRWLEGQLFGPLVLAGIPGWPLPWLEIPSSFRLSTISGTDVFTYPPGFPLVMAAAMAFGGELAAHLVPPLLGGVLVWETGELADLFGGRLARIVGAALMASCAAALYLAVVPMSDVPAAAWWALSLVFCTKGRPAAALASGLSAAMAILTRPNLAPLALIPLGLVLTNRSSRRALRGLVFATSAGVGAAILMWTQYVLYGSLLASGHMGIENTFALANIPGNFVRYPQWYAAGHTPAIVLALCAPAVFWHARNLSLDPAAGHVRHVALGLLVFAVGVFAAYLPYTQYSDPTFFRFMLPALAPLYALTAAVLAVGIEAIFRRQRLAVVMIVIALTAGFQVYRALQTPLTGVANSLRHVLVAGPYLDAVLPRNAAVITAVQSGSTRYATGRPILRPDFIPPQQLDLTIELAQRFGFHVYVLMDEVHERGDFQRLLLPHTKTLTLTWPPRARIGDGGRLSLYDLDDARRFAEGQRWPIDVVR